MKNGMTVEEWTREAAAIMVRVTASNHPIPEVKRIAAIMGSKGGKIGGNVNSPAQKLARQANAAKMRQAKKAKKEAGQ